jgi:ubiquinone/menaquinone biosynthesis C-methylase UbiE
MLELAQIIKNTKILPKILFRAATFRAFDLLDRIINYIEKEDNIIDIGAGLCNISYILKERGYEITALDVADYSFTPSVIPQIYNGKTMPYDDNTFSCSLLITVLHNIAKPELVLEEAIRVTSKKIIIIEDIYVNNLHKMISYIADSISNLDFFNLPHTNKTDSEWKTIFKKYGLKLVNSKYKYSFIVMKQATYILEK